MGRILTFLGGHGVTVLFAGVFLGLLLPDLARLLRPALAPCVAALLLFSMLRVEWGSIAAYLRRPLLTAALTAWMLLVSPLLTWAVLASLPLPGALTTAVVLMAAAPPILGATAIALLLGLDGALTLVVGLLSTLLAPLTVPPLALLLLGLELQVGLAEFMLRLGLVVVGALLGAVALRRLIGAARLRRHAARVDGLIVLVMLIFAVGIMDGVTATLFARPETVAIWIFAAFIANPALQILAALAFARFGRRLALTAGLLSGNCNMGLMLAALPPDADYDVTLYFALAQLPMYMLPALLRPFYRRLLAEPPRRAGDAA